jgi:hypothetical protein
MTLARNGASAAARAIAASTAVIFSARSGATLRYGCLSAGNQATNRTLMCLNIMSRPEPQPEAHYVVTRPRASDAIGCALRDAYDRELPPADMLTLLRQLNGNGEMRTRG